MSNLEVLTRCGYIALVGRPNVGKSTLLNHLVGQKISITSRKPQTTRQRILGLINREETQLIFVDTPGFYLGIEKKLNQLMNKTVQTTIGDVDVIVLMVDRPAFLPQDEPLLNACKKSKVPVYLLINKVDELNDKAILLPFLQKCQILDLFKEIIPVSALKGHNLEVLIKSLVQYMPEGPWLFAPDQITDRNARHLAAEFVREKITRQMGDELPYATAVEIENFNHKGNLIEISAVIHVEKSTQKAMLIGESGSRLKLIGSEARADLEALLGSQVMLRLWVKTKTGWSDDERALRSLGLED
jgi:GTP-binding protein Era